VESYILYNLGTAVNWG